MNSEIYTADLASRGIKGVGFYYSRIEDVLADIGPLIIEPHRHEYFEILWFTHGGGRHYLDFASYSIHPPVLFFIAKNQIHHFDDSFDSKGHMLRFNEDFVWRYPEEHAAMSRGSLFGVERQPIYIPNVEDLANIDCIIRQIANEMQENDDSLQQELLYHLANTFLIKVKRLAIEHPPDISFKKRRDMAIYYKFFSLMEKHYLDHYSVSQYAGRVGVCPKHLTEICKAITGKSVKQVLKERLLLEAKRYLRYSKLSIKEISDALNFNDYGYFSRFFKQATYKSPSDFRSIDSELYKK